MNPGFPVRGWQKAACALSSGVLLSLAYVYPALFVLAWVGFVPLLLAIRHAGLRESYLLGALAGLALYVGATHWVAEFVVNLKGYGAVQSLAMASLFWVYAAQSVGVIALLLTWLRRASPVPPLVLFPLIAVSVFIAFPTLFTMRPGETQSLFRPAIQAIEFTGLYGLDFIIALVNVALFGWLAGEADTANRRAAGFAAVAVLLWFGYGFYAMSAWKHEIDAWGTVRLGIVQPNEDPSIQIPPPRPGYSRAYPLEMALTAEAAAAGAEVVLWPESRFKGYFAHDHVRRAFRYEVARLGTPLIFHDQHRLHQAGEIREYNSVVFIDGEGRVAGSYRKRQRIAFGEYIPLVADIPWLRSWMLDFFAVHEIAPGAGAAVFRTGRIAFAPLVCYEVAFPIHAAESLAGRPEGKVLLTLSNDSWFGATRQPYMHGYTSALRAVENRVPLVHVLNNGPSLVVMPDGRFLFRSDFRATAGYVLDLPYSADSGGSLFSRHPYWFISTLYVVLGLVLLSAAVPAIRARRAARA